VIHRRHIGKWIGPFFKDLLLAEKSHQPMSPNSWESSIRVTSLPSIDENIYNLVNEIFEVGVANGLLVSNPVRSKIHGPSVLQDQEKGALSSEQCWALTAAVRKKRDKALLWTFMLTGMRQGEVFGLRR